jgi:hypothetical protein
MWNLNHKRRWSRGAWSWCISLANFLNSFQFSSVVHFPRNTVGRNLSFRTTPDAVPMDLDAEVSRISELTTQELRRELGERGLHKYLREHPALPKATLRAKYLRNVRRRSKRANGAPARAKVAATTNDDRYYSDEDVERDSVSLRRRCRQCNLKVVLNWIARILYSCTISTLVVELVLLRFAVGSDEGNVSNHAVVVAANVDGGGGGDARGPLECLTAIGVVFTTYVIFHRALGLTNTQVYWIQVVTSLFWLAFLVALVTCSKSCVAVRQRGRRAAAACGVEAEANAVGEALQSWWAHAFAP